MAQPSPISTTPAFSSPALTRIFSPVVGNFFSSFFEFLYEQCSLHMTEKIPSSVKFGSRPRIRLIRSNSSGVRPCSATIPGVTFGSASTAGIGTRQLNGSAPRAQSQEKRFRLNTKALKTVKQEKGRLYPAVAPWCKVRDET